MRRLAMAATGLATMAMAAQGIETDNHGWAHIQLAMPYSYVEQEQLSVRAGMNFAEDVQSIGGGVQYGVSKELNVFADLSTIFMDLGDGGLSLHAGAMYDAFHHKEYDIGLRGSLTVAPLDMGDLTLFQADAFCGMPMPNCPLSSWGYVNAGIAEFSYSGDNGDDDGFRIVLGAGLVADVAPEVEIGVSLLYLDDLALKVGARLSF